MTLKLFSSKSQFCSFFFLQTPEAKSPFLSSSGSSRTQHSNTSRRSGGTNAAVAGPPMLPPEPPNSRPRQMALAERGWDNGVGGYQTNSMLETRLATNNSNDGKQLTAPALASFYENHYLFTISIWGLKQQKTKVAGKFKLLRQIVNESFTESYVTFSDILVRIL
jgi:hypothetical protein